MAGKNLFSVQPAHWAEYCDERNDLFQSVAWQNMLTSAFGCYPLYIWNEHKSEGIAITVFKAGPFRIGYVGFPAGTDASSCFLTIESLLYLKSNLYAHGLDMLRIPVSAFHDYSDPLYCGLRLKATITAETAIKDLQQWCLTKVPKFQRNVKKASKLNVKIADEYEITEGSRLFELYRATIIRHSGTMRYSAKYFSLLIAFARENSRLRCLVARVDSKLVGFLVVALHRDIAYYLHGAIDPILYEYGGSALLFHEAISWAKDRGMRSFNLMASPNSQLSLVKYKEKLGGITRQERTYELSVRPFWARLFVIASATHKSVSHYFQ